MEMLIKNAKVISPADGLNSQLDILVRDGKIAEIGEGLSTDGEIINADAFQVYEELRISTAAPSEEQKKEVPHHLYSFVPLTEGYDIHRYQEDARNTIKKLKNLGKTPIFVGGSGLYIQ
jgi:hypothetical protein